MKVSIKKICKCIIAIVLLPITIIGVISFVSLMGTIKWYTHPAVLLLIGGSVYCVIHVVSAQKSFAYVIGHEAVHAVTSMLLGGKIISFFVSRKQGSVSTTKDNFIISLAPYCVPFYAVVILLCYYGVSIVVNVEPCRPTAIFLLGAALSHHFLLTVHYIKIGQRDITEHGILFSFTIIVLVNIIIVTLLLSIFLSHEAFYLLWTLAGRIGKKIILDISALGH